MNGSQDRRVTCRQRFVALLDAALREDVGRLSQFVLNQLFCSGDKISSHDLCGYVVE